MSSKKAIQDIDSSGDESMDQEIPQEQGMEIQVEFEGRNPQDPDFHGIRTLLKQLFLKANIDLSNLAELIISQNYVGSVIKQSTNDDQPDSEDEDDEDDANDTFGITTAVNITNKQTIPCIRELRELLQQLANEHATEEAKNAIKYVLENNSVTLGLLINERFVNIPVAISVPLLENLVSEIKRAARTMPYNFTHFILICKLHKVEAKEKKSKKNKGNDVYYSNPEEEIIAESAMASFEFSVEKESSSSSESWSKEDDEMMPYRKVLIFEASKLPTIINNIKSSLK